MLLDFIHEHIQWVSMALAKKRNVSEYFLELTQEFYEENIYHFLKKRSL
jgi:hypothetical protein